MYIVMAPVERRAEKKADNGEAPEATTIGDVVAAKGQATQRQAAPAAEAQAQQGS